MKTDRPVRPDFTQTREQARDVVKRLDTLLGKAPTQTSSPEEEIMRAIDTLRQQGKLSGDQGFVLEIVESYFQSRR